MSDEAKLEEGDINSDEVKYNVIIKRMVERKRKDTNVWFHITPETTKLQLLQSHAVNVLFFHAYRYVVKPTDDKFDACVESLYNLFGDDSKSCMYFIKQLQTIIQKQDGMDKFMREIVDIFPRYI